jgi:lysophospholipase L1-like esterase
MRRRSRSSAVALFFPAVTSIIAACSSSNSDPPADAATSSDASHHDGHVATDSEGKEASASSTDSASEVHDAGDGGRAMRDASHAPDSGGRDALEGADAAPDAKSTISDAASETAVDTGPPALRYIGRTLVDGTNPGGQGACTAATPCFEWSGTQVIAHFTGATEFHLTLEDDGNYYDVYVDGALQSTTIIGSASQTDYTIATGLSASTEHEVILYKRTEASTSGPTRVTGYTFPNGGTLLSPEPPATRRIEVVGDSISCGYGVLGPDATCTPTPANEDHDDSYGALTARALNADLYTIAASGRGMYENVDGTTTGTLPDIYGETIPYSSATTPSSWNFADWIPDVVVIDLGTNDFAGSATGDPGPEFVTTYVTFVQRVRTNYPDAWIFCTNGPMLSGTEYAQAQTYIQSVVSMVNDPKVTYLAFPTQNPANGEGCDGHPSPTTHQLMATQLTAAIESALGW